MTPGHVVAYALGVFSGFVPLIILLIRRGKALAKLNEELSAKACNRDLAMTMVYDRSMDAILQKLAVEPNVHKYIMELREDRDKAITKYYF